MGGIKQSPVGRDLTILHVVLRKSRRSHFGTCIHGRASWHTDQPDLTWSGALPPCFGREWWVSQCRRSTLELLIICIQLLLSYFLFLLLLLLPPSSFPTLLTCCAPLKWACLRLQTRDIL